MLDWNPEVTIDSKLAEGVRYVLGRFTKARRVALELELAEYREAMREKMLDYADNIEDPADTDAVKAAKATRRRAFDMWAGSMIERDLKPATIRVYVLGVEGLSARGVPIMTGADLLKHGHEDFADEAFYAINEHGGMTDAERKNSPLPTTSLEAEGGQMIATIVAPASSEAPTPSEAAAGTSLPA